MYFDAFFNIFNRVLLIKTLCLGQKGSAMLWLCNQVFCKTRKNEEWIYILNLLIRNIHDLHIHALTLTFVLSEKYIFQKTYGFYNKYLLKMTFQSFNNKSVYIYNTYLNQLFVSKAFTLSYHKKYNGICYFIMQFNQKEKEKKNTNTTDILIFLFCLY